MEGEVERKWKLSYITPETFPISPRIGKESKRYGHVQSRLFSYEDKHKRLFEERRSERHLVEKDLSEHRNLNLGKHWKKTSRSSKKRKKRRKIIPTKLSLIVGKRTVNKKPMKKEKKVHGKVLSRKKKKVGKLPKKKGRRRVAKKRPKLKEYMIKRRGRTRESQVILKKFPKEEISLSFWEKVD